MAQLKKPGVLTNDELVAYGLKPSSKRTRVGLSWQEKRTIVFNRDGHRCVYCGSSDKPLHCDHVVPHSQGGSNDLSNLATACKACNLRKHNRSLAAFFSTNHG